MIFGDYPCCGGILAVPIPDKTPVWQKEVCPHCGETVWHYLSRNVPNSYTEEQFLEKYIVNEDAKQVIHKD